MRIPAYLPVTSPTTDWHSESTKLNNIALQKEVTVKPFTSSLHSSIIIPLIMSKNNPRVSIVTGRVKNTSMGFIKMLSSPNTTATINAVMTLFTETPGKKYEIRSTNTAVKIMFISVFIIV